MLYGINLNGLADRILTGQKTIETRSRDVFKSFFLESDQRLVCIIDTSRKTPLLSGFCLLSKGFKYESKQAFDYAFKRHLVGENSPYYCNGNKWGYVVSAAMKLNYPVPLADCKSQNRSFRVVKREHLTQWLYLLSIAKNDGDEKADHDFFVLTHLITSNDRFD